MYSEKKQNTVKLKAYLLILSYINKIKVSNTQFKTDKTRSEERPARRRYVLQLNCMLCLHTTGVKKGVKEMAKDIEPKLKLIGEYLKVSSDDFFVIPEYQRGYSWNIVQCDKLWQDIEAFIDSQVADPYFFGTVIIDCSESNKFSLIDGQQRTTTFLLLLKALQLRIQEVLKNLKRDEDSEVLEEGLKVNRNKILEILYKTDEEGRVEIQKNWNYVKDIAILENKSINEQYKKELQTIIEAKDYFEAEKNCYRIPRKQKDNKYTNFFRNFKFFYGRLGDYKESQLNSFAKAFIRKCQVIEIRSWQIEQAITMFNSLNSTGMPLSDADIISAQMYSNAGNQKDEFNKRWETITKLSTELSSLGIIDIDAVLQQFMYISRSLSKEYIKNGYPDVTTPGLRNYYTIINKDILKDPLALCGNLSKITQIWDFIKEYPLVKLLLKFNENIKLYLISYLYRYKLEDITKESVLGVGECLLRLFTLLELVDAGYSSTNFKTFLFGENIKFVDTNVSCDEIKKDFDLHIRKNWKEEDIRQTVSDYEKNILVFLNEYLYAKEKKIAFNFSETVNIEHIMPASGHNIDVIRVDAGIESQEEFTQIVNKLGNKILLEENINKSISNEWFKTKKQKSITDKSGYKDSRYNIAKSLVDYKTDVWTQDDINRATEKVANRIVKFIFAK